MITVYMTVGLPGSGKSTWSKAFSNKNSNTVVVNRDAFRHMFKGEYVYDITLEHLVKGAAKQTFIECLNENYDIVIDETNFLKRVRKEWIDAVKEYEKDHTRVNLVAVVFTEMRNNLSNRMNNDRGISKEQWDTVIQGMKDKFEPVQQWEEGFDKVIHISFEKAMSGVIDE